MAVAQLDEARTDLIRDTRSAGAASKSAYTSGSATRLISYLLLGHTCLNQICD